jgi:GTPase SAR1 family protein
MSDGKPLLDKQYHYKVVIVGDSFTGKSSLLSRLSDKEFERAYAPTIGVDYVRSHTPAPASLYTHFSGVMIQGLKTTITSSLH